MDQPSTNPARVGSCIGIVGLICCVVSTALDYWYYLSITANGVPLKVYMGLWEICVDHKKGTQIEKQCFSVESAPGIDEDISWLHACQAFMTGSCVVLGIGLFFSILFSFKSSVYGRYKMVGGGACLLGGVMALVAVIVFAAEYPSSLVEDQVGGTLHAGFGLGVMASVLAATGGILILRNPTLSVSSFP